MKFNLKKSALSCFLSLMLTIGGSVNIQAAQNSLLQQENDLQKQNTTISNTTNLCVNGINYSMTKTIDANGNKKVLVVGGGQEVTAINDGKVLHLTEKKDGANEIINKNVDLNASCSSLPANTSVYKSASYWNCHYAYSDHALAEKGMEWTLSSGDDNGRWHGYDYGNITARDYAYDFASSVRELVNKQVSATAKVGVSAAAAIAGLIAGAASGGIASVIAGITAVAEGFGAVGDWVAAYNVSLDCNQNFQKFKQAL